MKKNNKLSKNNSSKESFDNNNTKHMSNYYKVKSIIDKVHELSDEDGLITTSLQKLKESYEKDFIYNSKADKFYESSVKDKTRELIPAIKEYIKNKKSERNKNQEEREEAEILKLEKLADKLNHEIMTTVIEDYDPNQDKTIKSNSYGSIINHLDNVEQGNFIIRTNDKPEHCLYTSSYKNIPNNDTKKCDPNDISQKVNVHTILQDSDYIQHLPKINNTTELHKISNYSEFKYPFKIVTSKNNNQCLHNYDINKYKFTECIPHVAQQYRMWDKELVLKNN